MTILPGKARAFAAERPLRGVLTLLLTALLTASSPAAGADRVDAQDSGTEEPSADSPGVRVAAPAAPIDPVDLLANVPDRVLLFSERIEIPADPMPGGVDAWRVELAGWLGEMLAPLMAAGDCADVLGASNARIAEGLVQGLAQRAASPGRPIATAPRAERLVIPDKLPELRPQDVEMTQAFGMLPLEISLSGEWSRAVAARLAGPPPRDPLLRLTRAARLEGVARLAGISVTVSGSGIAPDELGGSLLALDLDRAGLPRDALLSAINRDDAGPLVRAAARVVLEDGLRWALFHWLRGGRDELEAALGRPAVSPEELLRPGRRIGPPAGRPPGCRLGPRLATALLIGDDDPPWVGDLVGDSFVQRGERSILGWLAFEDEAGARRAAADMTARGLRAEAVGRVIALYRSFD